MVYGAYPPNVQNLSDQNKTVCIVKWRVKRVHTQWLNNIDKTGAKHFSAYVALKECETIRLLVNFDDNLFTEHPLEDLRPEDLKVTLSMGYLT